VNPAEHRRAIETLALHTGGQRSSQIRRPPSALLYSLLVDPAEGVIWFEVEAFLRYFDHFATPTGIQRVCFEISLQLWNCWARNNESSFAG